MAFLADGIGGFDDHHPGTTGWFLKRDVAFSADLAADAVHLHFGDHAADFVRREELAVMFIADFQVHILLAEEVLITAM